MNLQVEELRYSSPQIDWGIPPEGHVQKPYLQYDACMRPFHFPSGLEWRSKYSTRVERHLRLSHNLALKLLPGLFPCFSGLVAGETLSLKAKITLNLELSGLGIDVGVSENEGYLILGSS